jgi:hypothetical protein
MDPLPPSLQHTLASLLVTHDEEYTCDEAGRIFDRYLEQRAAGAVEVSAEIKLLERHLELCPECREVCEAVLRVLRGGA